MSEFLTFIAAWAVSIVFKVTCLSKKRILIFIACLSSTENTSALAVCNNIESFLKNEKNLKHNYLQFD